MANFNKLKELFRSESTLKALSQCGSAEDALALLNGQGANLSHEELKQLLEALRQHADTGSDAMDIDEMDAIAGGVYIPEEGEGVKGFLKLNASIVFDAAEGVAALLDDFLSVANYFY